MSTTHDSSASDLSGFDFLNELWNYIRLIFEFVIKMKVKLRSKFSPKAKFNRKKYKSSLRSKAKLENIS